MIIMKDKMIVIREPKTFHFNFDLLKDVERNWKHEIELIIKHNESLAEHQIKNDIIQFLATQKQGNDIHEH